MEANNPGKTQCSVVNVSSAALIGLAGVGLLRGLSFATSAAKFLWRKHLRPGKHLIDYGQWAVVTGASDGIGREYCNYLAKQGDLLWSSAPQEPPRRAIMCTRLMDAM